MLIRLWKSAVQEALTSRPSILFSALHHLCATLFFSRPPLRRKILQQQEKNSLKDFSVESRTILLFYFLCFFPKPLILNGSRQIFHQYHFCGLSRCTLIVCFGSVMSSQRPYVCHPSATT